MIECSNGAYYTGYTTDIERRYQEHREGSSKCKYTRSFPPRRLAACWEFDCELSQALKIEHLIKNLSKPQKQNLVHDTQLLKNILQSKGYDSAFSISTDFLSSINRLSR